jgi:hypothetical protein
MIRLLFVGDGDRDAATNPHIVRTIIGVEIDASHRAWKELRLGGGGNDRKLKFAIRQARDAGIDGVVATVDQDNSPSGDRLRVLAAARREDREKAAPLPTALGCANPHAEAWLLDDEVAIRSVLHLTQATVIPTVRKASYPKDTIGELHAGSSRADEPIRTILAELAQALVASRCQHTRETGFDAFTKDVRDEIGPLAR